MEREDSETRGADVARGCPTGAVRGARGMVVSPGPRASGAARTFLLRAGAVLAVGLALLGPAAAQGQRLRVDGRVQWVSSQKMMVIPDTGGLPVPVDLTRVPLGDYATLGPGSWVAVEGVVSSDGRRLIATSISGGSSGWGSQSP